jgi:hypothetical protein
MTDSTATPSYGSRFFDELRRATGSTSGITYADIPRIRLMDRDQVLVVMSKVYDLDSLLRLDSSSPEAFAREIARGVARASNPVTNAVLLSTLLDLLS